MSYLLIIFLKQLFYLITNFIYSCKGTILGCYRFPFLFHVQVFF